MLSAVYSVFPAIIWVCLLFDSYDNIHVYALFECQIKEGCTDIRHLKSGFTPRLLFSLIRENKCHVSLKERHYAKYTLLCNQELFSNFILNIEF